MIPEETSWESKSNKSYPELTENIEADVVIVGAGISGVFNAYILSKAGFKVVVLEKDKDISRRVTLRTTAFITQLLDTSFAELVSMFGKERAKLIWKSGQEAIGLIADIVKSENIDCEFKFSPIYTYAKDAKQFRKLLKEYEAIKKAGFEVQLQEIGDKLKFKNAGFMEVPKQAMFQPIKFTKALAEAAELIGAEFFVNSEVLAIEGLNVKTERGRVQVKDIVIATHVPLDDKVTRFKKVMYRSYVYELEIAKGLIGEGLYLDMSNPYHYFRIDSYENFDRMIVGGEDHREDIKINPDKNFGALEEYIKNVLGGSFYKTIRKWSGRVLEPVDGLALIGEVKPHTYITTGFSGNGMTYSAMSASIIRDLILERKNVYADLYNPKRTITIKQLVMKSRDYIGEIFGGAIKNFFAHKSA